MLKQDVLVPLDVPGPVKKYYIKNYLDITKETGRLMLFAGDQKIEHLNYDFFGKGIHADDSNPNHLFKVANRAKIGAFATQLGLIARYGMNSRTVPFVVKLNSKTNLVKTSQKEPLSRQLVDIKQVVDFKRNSGLNVVGVGYTIYMGSEYEAEMLREAQQIVLDAHNNGLIVIFWIYPRGKAVKDERDPHIIASACGVGACLGADFVKVNYPYQRRKDSKELFSESILAAGRTKVICAGGESTDPKKFLQTLRDQIDAGAGGNATGRNIHQKGLNHAIRMCNAIYAITIEDKSVEEALAVYNNGSKK